jgi:Spy/CpxP family protein refolding chaperone
MGIPDPDAPVGRARIDPKGTAMSVRVPLQLLLAPIVLVALLTASSAQDATPGSDAPGSEAGNFGLIPFQFIPTMMLTDEQKETVRALEDRQLQERRALEDRYAAELRALLIRQAEEREALIGQLMAP